MSCTVYLPKGGISYMKYKDGLLDNDLKLVTEIKLFLPLNQRLHTNILKNTFKNNSGCEEGSPILSD